MEINVGIIENLKQKLNILDSIDILAITDTEAEIYENKMETLVINPINNDRFNFLNDTFIIPIDSSVIAFKGSTKPNFQYIESGEKVNQLMFGFYTHYNKGKHNKGLNTAHDALRQTRTQPVLRTFDNETKSFKIDGVIEFGNVHDNIHAAWCRETNQQYYESKGCQVIMGYPQCEKRKRAEGQWKTFSNVIYSMNKQVWNYLLIPYRWLDLKNDVCIFGSKGEKVKKLQKFLKITQDGVFGKDTLLKVIEFQKKYNLVVDGVAGVNTFEMLCLTSFVKV